MSTAFSRPGCACARAGLHLLVAGTLALAALALAIPSEADGATVSERRAGRVASAMRIAMAQRGDPYVYGAAGPRAFDCSGLTSYSYHRAGMRRLPRTSAAQAQFANHIRRSQMRRGDLIFFHSGGHVYHVGLYAGRGRVLHAARPGTTVGIDRIWTNSWFPGTLRFR